MCFFALVAFVLTITESKSGSGSRSALSDSCNPTDCSPQSPLSMGILQAGILECVALSLPLHPIPQGDLANPGIEPGSSELQAILYPLSHQESPFLPFS